MEPLSAADFALLRTLPLEVLQQLKSMSPEQLQAFIAALRASREGAHEPEPAQSAPEPWRVRQQAIAQELRELDAAAKAPRALKGAIDAGEAGDR